MKELDLRRECADRLEKEQSRARAHTAFVGLDGFVDEIIHVVDKRDSAESFQRIPTIARFGERIVAAAGKSTNIELVDVQVKLGGNGPILANALATLGVQVTYLGALGYPRLHPVFEPLAAKAKVHSITEPGFTDALEFEDGKVLLTRTQQLREVTWARIEERFGRSQFEAQFGAAQLVAFVNWTMVPYMSELWQSLQQELCPALDGPRRMMFIDLADPEKRMVNDVCTALELIVRFQEKFDVTLGLNEKEAWELGKVLGLHPKPRTADGLAVLARELADKLPIGTVVIHPVRYALACGGGALTTVQGPFVARPVLTTGAGDHFNAGFCLGRLLGFEDAMSLLVGVATSGFYVRSGRSPELKDLIGLLRQWPVD